MKDPQDQDPRVHRSRDRRRSRTDYVTFAMAVALSLAAASAHTTVIPGPATYSVTTLVEQNRGSAPPTLDNRVVHSHAGSGQSSASTGTVVSFIGFPGFISGNRPTEAGGTSTNTTLHAISRVTGATQFINQSNVVPNVLARTRAENNRLFQFSDPSAATVPVTFNYLLDGLMMFGMVADLPGASGHSAVHFGLHVTDTVTSAITPVFDTRATLDRTGLNPFFTTVSGAAALIDWTDAFTPGTVPGDLPGSALNFLDVLDVNYFGAFLNAYQAPVNRLLSFNWFLETEASMQGNAIIDALLESNFRDTAVVGFEIGTGASGASFQEFLSIPDTTPSLAAPAPDTLGLFMMGGLAVMWRHRRVGVNHSTLRTTT